MLSGVLARMRSVRHKVLVAANNERSCLSRDLCCGVSCHPSRLYSALERPLCRGVSTFAPGAPPTSCKFHYYAGTIRGRGAALARVVRDLAGRNRGNTVSQSGKTVHKFYYVPPFCAHSA